MDSSVLNNGFLLAGFWQLIVWICGLIFAAVVVIAPLPVWIYRVYYRNLLRQRQAWDDRDAGATPKLDRPTHPDPSTLGPYRYRPLPSPKHIRVLVLEPGSSGSQITCSLQEVDLSASGQYFEAISYRWDGEPRTIECENSGWIAIQSSLYELLVQLRKPSQRRYIWADAVCINQNDTAEKDVQLPLMKQIYSQCDLCINWLGWHNNEDALAFHLLTTLSTVGATARSKVFDDTTPHATRLRPVRGLYSKYRTTDRQWIALSRLLSGCSWFLRTWTFQEALLPRKVTFMRGQFELPGEAFYTAMSFIDSTQLQNCLPDRGEGYSSCVKLANIRRNFEKWTSRTNGELLNILRDARDRDAFERKDKVLGVAGLCDEEAFKQLGISCEQSTATVYSIVAEHILRSTEKPLQLLSAVSWSGQAGVPRDSTLQSLPTWVPNWDEKVVMSSQMSDHETVSEFCAGGSHAAYLDITYDESSHLPRFLHLHAKYVTSISTILRWDSDEVRMDYDLKYPHPDSLKSRIVEAGLSPKRWHELHRFIGSAVHYIYLAQPIYELPLPYPPLHQYFLQRCFQAISQTVDGDGREQLSTFWRLLARGNPKYLKSTASEMRPKKATKLSASWMSLKSSARRAVSADYREVPAQLPERPEVVTDILSEHQARRATPKFHRDLEAWTRERAFCTTINGSVGWIPVAAKPGNSIYIFQGCDLPFVLRPSINGDSSFIVVGHCYLDGIMDGEVARNSEVPFQDICLA